MHYIPGRSFQNIHELITESLLSLGKRVEGSTRWQGQDIASKPEMVPIELQNVIFEMGMPKAIGLAAREIHPNLPWADDHFEERVGGFPLNPPPSSKWWPFMQAGHVMHTDIHGMFSHTYPERFWPKHAGHEVSGHCDGESCEAGPQAGIRFQYGDLMDVVALLASDPDTRQAYLPIWFPEDTGAAAGQRVPCSLGYHFMIRDGKLNVTYMIRAVDFMRHFRDDVYMAVRLAYWICETIWTWTMVQVIPGDLIMHTMSMHIFAGDLPAMRTLSEKVALGRSQRLLGAMR